MEAKHLIVENGVLKTTDKPMPVEPKVCEDECNNPNGLCFGKCYLYLRDKQALESWKQEALPVVNTIWLYNNLLILHDKGVDLDAGLCAKTDGIYDAPAGLEYEVKEEPEFPGFDHTSYPTFKKVAILSFASPKEETKKDWVQEQVDKFQKFLDSMSDEELDKMVKQVEATGISGPTVEEYFASFGGRKEVTPASKEKPDLNERLFEAIQRGLNMAGAMRDNPEEYILGQVLEEIAALQEEIRQLKEGMGGVVNWIQKVGVDNAIRGSVIIEMIEELKNKQ